MLCTKCNKDKPSERFTSGRRQCNDCRASAKRERRKEETPEVRAKRLASGRLYVEENREQVSVYKAQWRRENSQHVREKNKSYYVQNSSLIRERSKVWRLSNPDRRAANNKSWREENPDKQRQSEIASKQRRRQSGQVRLQEGVSEQIRLALRGGKDGRSWETLVGFTRGKLVDHLERQFDKLMSWDNYGDWHIDHIVPASLFKYEMPEDPDFKACWALTNLRPLWAIDNIKKRDKRTHLL